jgi:glycosyltransferase involved in cell wall biosynthesis
MTTYNGVEYLEEQLDSIRGQTCAPDEVLVFDDCSSDTTVSLVTGYIERHRLPWSVSVNPKNVGWRRNFMQGIARASHPFVFLCDQDDIWEPERCEKMLQAMDHVPGCNLLMTNYTLYFSGTSDSRYRKTSRYRGKRIERIPCTGKNLLNVLRPGCTYCLRKEFFEHVKPYWYDELPHDRFLYAMALLSESAYLYNYRSLRFRQHPGSSTPVGQRTKSWRMSDIRYLQRFVGMLVSYVQAHPGDTKSRVQSDLDRILRFLRQRHRYFEFPGLLPWCRLAIVYGNLYPTKKKLFGDLYIGMQNEDKIRSD